MYPTLALIALDTLPFQASSVSCERLFSASKRVADDCCASLGATQFGELQIMKFAWRNNISDLSVWNSKLVEEVDMDEYCELLDTDNHGAESERTGVPTFEDFND
jgi:hypothetical protein